MLQDRFARVMLVIIAVLLAINIIRPGDSVLATNAQARTTTSTGRADVRPLKGYEVTGLQDIVALGDGKSFVVSGPGKFMVYQVTGN